MENANILWEGGRKLQPPRRHDRLPPPASRAGLTAADRAELRARETWRPVSWTELGQKLGQCGVAPGDRTRASGRQGSASPRAYTAKVPDVQPKEMQVITPPRTSDGVDSATQT